MYAPRVRSSSWRPFFTVYLSFILTGFSAAVAAPPAATPTIALSATQQKKLRTLVESRPDAQSLAKSLLQRADTALTEQPHPVAQIRSEGLLASDPLRQATQEAMKDMARLRDLSYAWVLSGDKRYALQTKKFILAWASTAEPTGNPIDATKLEPLFMAYDLTRAEFSNSEKQQLAQWLTSIAQLQIAERKPNAGTGINNWHSHRLKIVGLIAFLLNDKQLIQSVLEGYREQIAVNLAPDGTSLDFHERDAIHYHLYTLEPLLTLAMVAEKNGVRNVYAYTAPTGASLKKSVEFVVPFAEGKQTHAEFVNSNVKFDQERAKAGQKEYAAGAPFDPKSSRDMFALAAYFDSKLAPLACKLADKSGREFATWQMVLNAAGK